ncbi:hypothetical protein [Chitinophaga pinensis]|uniref:Uncharacterized protein n=1 Tax=Chitinophaga pinensis TaxID=79329 RepID=A0A5C6LTK9_9BACT|nr:hypothetical protein [Chitinophaga pinensis]TWW00262.1 hypothetical protein FEF09_13065 [Chitinophaga pinensis]
MKRKILFVILLLSCVTVSAQQKQSPYAVRISRILKRMPAQSQLQLDSCMQQITALGINGLAEMACMLRPPGKGDNTALQYALNGYANYVAAATRDSLRNKAVKAWGKALRLTTDVSCKTFLIEQLQFFGDNAAVTLLKPICYKLVSAILPFVYCHRSKLLLPGLRWSWHWIKQRVVVK